MQINKLNFWSYFNYDFNDWNLAENFENFILLQIKSENITI